MLVLEKLQMQSNFLSCGNVNVENAQKEYFTDFSHICRTRPAIQPQYGLFPRIS